MAKVVPRVNHRLMKTRMKTYLLGGAGTHEDDDWEGREEIIGQIKAEENGHDDRPNQALSMKRQEENVHKALEDPSPKNPRD
ncbi:hypothetical protein CVT25_002056 [Psilocybe cyanescens]|uniref:Uncharacterized protein n=1 Tax=Psilocybe cyanescens TaxID=93625 RepID=A0A409X9B7_PSICY|nr:hypothetical protein CVT25_002056 [Psilocybe cyanescens]